MEEYRECTNCNDLMSEGYCIRDGEEYFCSDDCLHGWYSEKEYEECETLLAGLKEAYAAEAGMPYARPESAAAADTAARR